MKLFAYLTAIATFAFASTACAQAARPLDKPIRMVVPFAAGGGVDNAARVLANQLRTRLGVAVVVENRAGASGSVGGKAVQIAPADGTTLLFSASTHVMAKQVLREPLYDPQTDFAPVARVGEAPLMLVVAPKHDVKNLKALLDEARKQPEKWSAAIPAAGAASHIATLLLAKQGKVTFMIVPYKGTQPAVTDVAGGHADLLLDSMISLLPLAQAGKVKALAITAKQRSPLAPDVPTVAEAGFPDTAYVSWYGVWAPKDTPPDVVAQLNRQINAAVQDLAKAGAWSKLGIDPVNETPDQMKRFIASDVAQSADLLKSAGFKPE